MSSSAEITLIIYVCLCMYMCYYIYEKRLIGFCSDCFSLEQCYSVLARSLKGVFQGILSATVFAPDFLLFLLKVLDHLSITLHFRCISYQKPVLPCIDMHRLGGAKLQTGSLSMSSSVPNISNQTTHSVIS